jgi:hypothetical protein
MAGFLRLTYEGTSVDLDEFTDTEVPGAVVSQASLEFTALGVAYSTGPASRQRKMYSVSSYVTKSQWSSLNTIFQSWDQDRANGANTALVTLQDGLLFPSSPTTMKCFFTEPPALSKVTASNNNLFVTSFVLMEVG